MKPHVLILGDTLAGLVTAWRLCAADFQVTILKTAATPPDLASPLYEEEEALGYDSSDALVLYGPHTHTDSLLRDLGIAQHESNWKRIAVEFKTESLTPARFPTPLLPAPWHTLWALSTFSAIPYRQRWRLLNYIEKVWEGVTVLPSALDLQTTENWLTSIGQTGSIQTSMWEPLCRFLLGTSLAQTRAGSFAMMLTRVFIQSRHDSPRINQLPQLSTWLVNSLIERLQPRGATIEDIPAIEHLQVRAEQVTGVGTSHGTLYAGSWYVAAVHPTTLSSFLPERLLARFSSFHQMGYTSFAPRVTFNALSDHADNKSRLILHSGRFSWTVCHPIHSPKKRATLLSCVSTGDPDFLSESDEHIQSCAIDILGNIFPHQDFSSKNPLHRPRIIRQPFGFVPQLPGAESSPPSNQTPIRNLLLAGSWTDTGASTEMESAIASGELCAKAIIDQCGEHD